MTAPQQYSPDGRWWWDGVQWVPVAPAPVPQGNDGKAIASLVCGIVWVCGLASVPAVVLGHLSRRDAKRAGREPSGLSLAGLILGYVGLAGAVVLIALGALGFALDDAEADAKAQLLDAARAEEVVQTATGTYTDDVEVLRRNGFDPDGPTLVVLRANETGFCLQVRSWDDEPHYYSSEDGLTTEPCVP